MIAAMIEQNHDENGIALAARRSRRTTPTSSSLPGPRSSAEAVARSGRGRAPTCCSTTATAGGREVRRRRPDRVPVRVTVGKKTLEDGAVDVRDRATGEEQRVPRRGGDDLMPRSGASATSRSARRRAADGRDRRDLPRRSRRRRASPRATSTTSCTATGRCRRTTSSSGSPARSASRPSTFGSTVCA